MKLDSLLFIASSALWQLSTAQLKTFSGHTDSIYSAAVSGDNLFTGSADTTVKQWSVSSGQLVQTFTHASMTDTVWAVAVKDDYLFVANDFKILQFSISSGQLMRTMANHISTIKCLAISGNILISGSTDNTARTYTISAATAATGIVLTGHSSLINAVAANSDFIFTGSSDNTIKKWAFNGTLIKTLTGHTYSIRSLTVNGEYLLSGSSDYTIRKWQISSGDYVETLDINQFGLYTLAVSGDYLVYDVTSSIKQRQLSKNTIIREFTAHTASINSIVISGDYIYTASTDKTAKQWCGINSYQSGTSCVACPTNSVCSSVDGFTCDTGYAKSSNGLECQKGSAANLAASAKGALLAVGVAIVGLW